MDNNNFYSLRRLIIRTNSLIVEMKDDSTSFQDYRLILDSNLIDKKLLQCTINSYGSSSWYADLSSIIPKLDVQLGDISGIQIAYAKGTGTIPKLTLPSTFNPIYENDSIVTGFSRGSDPIPIRTIADKRLCGYFHYSDLPSCVHLVQDGEIYLEYDNTFIYFKKEKGDLVTVRLQIGKQ